MCASYLPTCWSDCESQARDCRVEYLNLEMHRHCAYLLDCSGDTVSSPLKKLTTSPSSMQAASRHAQKV